MWIDPPQPTQAQRDKGNAMAARILEMRRAQREQEEQETISTDELSEEELRAYFHSLQQQDKDFETLPVFGFGENVFEEPESEGAPK